MAAPLLGSLIHDTVVKDWDLQERLGPPEGGSDSFDEAIRKAAADVDTGRWMRAVRWGTGGVGGLPGSLLTDPKGRWYTRLEKPSNDLGGLPLWYGGSCRRTSLSSALWSLPPLWSSTTDRRLIPLPCTGERTWC